MTTVLYYEFYSLLYLMHVEYNCDSLLLSFSRIDLQLYVFFIYFACFYELSLLLIFPRSHKYQIYSSQRLPILTTLTGFRFQKRDVNILEIIFFARCSYQLHLMLQIARRSLLSRELHVTPINSKVSLSSTFISL